MKGMKKRVMIISLLGISLCLILAFSICSPALADIGTDINSHWASTPPTINGNIISGEWSGAAIRNFAFNMRDNSNTHHWYKNATLYIMNDYNNLYIAVRIYNDTYYATDLANKWKGVAVLFNNNDNGSLGGGENGEAKTTWSGSPFYSANDLYYNTTDSSWYSDVSAGKHNNGSIAFTHTNPVTGALGNWTFEMSIPLIGSDLGYDFHITKPQLPKVVGYKVEFEDVKNNVYGVYPDDGSNPLDQITNAASFGDLIIHPLYYLTILTTTGGPTVPAPGVYPYGYGTLVPVTATANAGYMFDHWTLDAAPVGAANPYTVTMDQNHTLEAFFKPVPPPSPVGGLSFSLASKTSMRSLVGYGAIFGIFFAAIVVIKRRRK
jgi:hypothetical protein